MDLGRLKELEENEKCVLFHRRKTTLIRQAARKVGPGVIYVDG